MCLFLHIFCDPFTHNAVQYAHILHCKSRTLNEQNPSLHLPIRIHITIYPR